MNQQNTRINTRFRIYFLAILCKKAQRTKIYATHKYPLPSPTPSLSLSVSLPLLCVFL